MPESGAGLERRDGHYRPPWFGARDREALQRALELLEAADRRQREVLAVLRRIEHTVGQLEQRRRVRPADALRSSPAAPTDLSAIRGGPRRASP